MDLINKGLITDDAVPNYRQVGFMLDYVRAKLIRQDRDRNWSRQTEFEQKLGCFDLIEVDKAECCTISLDCPVKRIDTPLPKFVRFKDKPGITFAGAIDNVTRFDIILPDRVPYIKYSKYTSSVPRLYYLNNYLYTTSMELTNIAVRGILESPMDAKAFLCDGEACITDDSEYPLPLDMVSAVTQHIITQDLRVFFSIPPDNENDATPEAGQS
jgi:hypothetical protein